ncbi:MAG: glycine cleavage system protein GcvH [Chloroflexi bacterium]|nr:glycine cleavage system protein GcvH [Chloroflexota bacterium]
MEFPLRPEGVRYSKEHEWVALDDEGFGIIGISDYAAAELGDVVYVQLPDGGARLKQFTKFGEVESVKAVSDLYAPVSGEVLAINNQVMFAPEVVNMSPFGMGWLMRVRLNDAAELENLLTNDQYEAYLKDLERKALE